MNNLMNNLPLNNLIRAILAAALAWSACVAAQSFPSKPIR